MRSKFCFSKGEYRSPHRLADLPKDTSVLLALSGGADSRALLHVLANEAKKNGFSLLLAHVNHGIRGEEALRDETFCKALAEQYGLEICILRADVPTLAKDSGKGLEEAAREVRYAYFEGLMKERQISILVTAHHADDALETVLFHLARGSGRKGLCGIAPVRPFGDGVLVRPLLQVPRQAILEYCRQNGLEFVTDSTNSDTSYARNRIRSQVIPVLEELFEAPQIRAAALCEQLREEEAFLESQAAKYLSNVRCVRGLSISKLLDVPHALLKRVLLTWLDEYEGLRAERVQLVSLETALKDRKRPCEITLGGGFSAVFEGDLLFVHTGKQENTESLQIPFSIGVTELASLGLRIEVEKINKLSIANTINSNEMSVIINSTLYFRTRQDGDVILQGGMHRKLRKLYNAAKIPPSVRERLPLLCDGEGIVWAPFIGARDGLPTEGEAVKIRVVFTDANADSR